MMAVPVAVKAERGITRGLISAEAFGPERAQRLDDLSFPRRRALERLLRQGVVREVEPGIYWLDPAAYAYQRAVRRNRIRWIMLLMIALVTVLVMLGIVRM
jgi:hypothetical protein